MKASELKGKKAEQLVEMLTQLKKEGFNLRFQKAAGSLENTARLRQVRRDAARVKTALTALKAQKAGA